MKATFRIVLAVFLLMSASGYSQKLSKTDLANMYSEYNFTNFEPLVYHTSDESSTVYLNISLHHFLYRPDETGKPTAQFRVTHTLYPSYASKSPVETATHFFSDTLYAGEVMEMAVDFEVRAPFPGSYVLHIEVTDLNQPEHSAFKFIPLHKESRFSSQNFFLTDHGEYPLFEKYILQDNNFRIRFNNAEKEELIIRYYNQEFPIAKPPFAMERNMTYTFEPDSFYSVALENGMSSLLELPNTGIYHIQADIARPEGLTLYRFHEGFPDVNSPAMALAPLRYLSTEREFEKMLSYQDYKIVVDSFWLERASYDPGRAKNMIKKFYGRVVDANVLFSSFQEGWKTDRGLIFIIYGPPFEVYRKDGEEEWIYGERGNPMSIRFYFYANENPFTANDYSLQRSPVYKTSWYIAVENWRR